MRLGAAFIVSVTLCGGCVHDGLLPANPANAAADDFPSDAPSPIRSESVLGQEITLAFRIDAAQLSPYGVWMSDPLYLEKWCPTGPGAAGFVPYLSHGRWNAAPTGDSSPYWVTGSDGAPWEDLTLHHGWWVRQPAAATSPWCWVPGLEKTPAQVVWRARGEYVGWAPAPPPLEQMEDEDTDTDDDAEGDPDDGLAWSFALAGSILDDLSDVVLRGDDAARARERTHRSREEWEGDRGWRGPSRGEIAAGKVSPPAARMPSQTYRPPSEPTHGQPFSGARVASRGSSYAGGGYSGGGSSHESGSWSHGSGSSSHASGIAHGSSGHSSSSDGCGGSHSSSVAHASYPHK